MALLQSVLSDGHSSASNLPLQVGLVVVVDDAVDDVAVVAVVAVVEVVQALQRAGHFNCTSSANSFLLQSSGPKSAHPDGSSTPSHVGTNSVVVEVVVVSTHVEHSTGQRRPTSSPMTGLKQTSASSGQPTGSAFPLHRGAAVAVVVVAVVALVVHVWQRAGQVATTADPYTMLVHSSAANLAHSCTSSIPSQLPAPVVSIGAAVVIAGDASFSAAVVITGGSVLLLLPPLSSVVLSACVVVVVGGAVVESTVVAGALTNTLVMLKSSDAVALPFSRSGPKSRNPRHLKRPGVSLFA